LVYYFDLPLRDFVVNDAVWVPPMPNSSGKLEIRDFSVNAVTSVLTGMQRSENIRLYGALKNECDRKAVNISGNKYKFNIHGA
jgi:hypothetical protein